MSSSNCCFLTCIQISEEASQVVGFARGHQRADTLKPYSQKTTQSNHTRTTALSNSMKLSHAFGATSNGRVMVEISDRMWSTGEGNGKPLQYSCLEIPMNSMKRRNDRILKEELPRSVGAQYASEDQWRITPERMKGWSQNKNNMRWLDGITDSMDVNLSELCDSWGRKELNTTEWLNWLNDWTEGVLRKDLIWGYE